MKRPRELGDWDVLWHEVGRTFSPGARLEPFLLLDAVTSGGGSGLLLAQSMLTACDAV